VTNLLNQPNHAGIEVGHQVDLVELKPADDFDAELRFAMLGVRVADPKACQCGEVLKGVLKPWLFGLRH